MNKNIICTCCNQGYNEKDNPEDYDYINCTGKCLRYDKIDYGITQNKDEDVK